MFADYIAAAIVVSRGYSAHVKRRMCLLPVRAGGLESVVRGKGRRDGDITVCTVTANEAVPSFRDAPSLYNHSPAYYVRIIGANRSPRYFDNPAR